MFHHFVFEASALNIPDSPKVAAHLLGPFRMRAEQISGGGLDQFHLGTGSRASGFILLGGRVCLL